MSHADRRGGFQIGEGQRHPEQSVMGSSGQAQAVHRVRQQPRAGTVEGSDLPSPRAVQVGVGQGGRAPCALKNSLTPIGDTMTGRTGKKYLVVSNGEKNATPNPPFVIASSTPCDAVQRKK